MKKLYRCDYCNYEEWLEPYDLNDRSCPNCDIGQLLDEEEQNEIIREEETNETVGMDIQIDNYILNTLEQEMNKMGNNFCFNTIESIANAKTRITYRKYFIKLGGQIPENVYFVTEISGKFFVKERS